MPDTPAGPRLGGKALYAMKGLRTLHLPQRPRAGGLPLVWLALVWLLGALAGPAQARVSTITFDTAEGYQDVSDAVQWLRETGDTPLSPDEAWVRWQAGAFAPSAASVPSDGLQFGVMHGAVWLAFSVANATDSAQLVLEFRNPRLSYIELYTLQDGTFVRQSAGAAQPLAARSVRYPMPAFRLTVPPGETQPVLLRIQNLGDMRTRLHLWDEIAFMQHMGSAYFPDLVLVGMLAILCIFQMLVFALLREPVYGYLSLFTLSSLGFFMGSNGTGYLLLWHEWPWFGLRANSFFSMCMFATFMLFTLAFLRAREMHPRFYALGLAFVLLTGANIVYVCLAQHLLRVHVALGLLVLGIAITVGIVVAGLWRRRRATAYYAVTALFTVAASVQILLTSIGILSARWVVESPIPSVLISTSILLWTFELAERTRTRARHEKRTLEEQVKARTSELRQALSEVKTLSGLLPICSHCKKIRDDGGYWSSVESYLLERTDASFTHGICPDCLSEHYPHRERRPDASEGSA